MSRRVFLVSCMALPIAFTLLACGCRYEYPVTKVAKKPRAKVRLSTESSPEESQPSLASDLAEPVRLEADGKPIDIATLSRHAHAGPWVADVDCDGDRDLLVGDFPGYFWFFENEYSDGQPKYAAGVKFQAGGTDAKVPVY